MDNYQHQMEFDKFHRGKFTASECYKLMGEKGGITTATAQTYILEKVAEELYDPNWVDDSFKGRAIEWGITLEPDAADYYSLAFNIKVDKPQGQTALWCDKVGCSPDLIAYPQEIKPYGVEIKCPYETSNHVRYMLLKNAHDLKLVKKEYYWQVVMCMLIYEFQYYEFCTYDPRFSGANRMFVLPIYYKEVVDDMAKLKASLLDAVTEKNRILSLINN